MNPLDQSQHIHSLEKELMQLKREQKIEASLDRVRARTMAMQKSDELAETAFILFEQFKELGETPDQITIGIFDESKNCMEGWITLDGRQLNRAVAMPIGQSSVIDLLYTCWKSQQKSLTIDLSGEELRQWLKFRKDMSQASQVKAGKPSEVRRIITAAYFTKGYLLFSSDSPPPPTSLPLLERFAGVFNLTYTRFLDLQNAEAQTREARIEAALERVRSRTMAMHHTDELKSIIGVVFKELTKLELQLTRVAIWIFNEVTSSARIWIANPEIVSSANNFFLNYNELPPYLGVLNAWKNGGEFWQYLVIGEDKKQWESYLFGKTDFSEFIPKEIKEKIQAASHYTFHASIHHFGCLHCTVDEPLSREQLLVYQRFGKVFEQSYTRFLDLQKAEAQAREALIEASLERVRSKTMAMHNSQDVTAATETMFDELRKLGSDNLRVGMAHIHDNRTMDVFGITNLDGGSKMTGFGLFGMDEHPVWQRLFESWLKKEDFFTFLAGKEKDDYFNNINSHRGYLPQQLVDFPDNYFNGYYFDQGIVWAYSLKPHSDSDREIMKRFATVFSLTFRRYQDLRKAEAQAREAQIEASLERVRSRTMAMHNSEDVVEATSVVFMELHRLGIETLRCGILLIDESKTMEVWSTTRAKEGQPAKIIGRLDMTIHPSLVGLFHAWKNKEEWYEYLLRGQDRINYYQTLSSIPSYESWSQFMNDPDHSLHACIFNAGALYAFAVNPLSSEDRGVMKRFTVAFSQTFLRYRDLQKAEAQTHEAQIEAALERVRAASMAMHKSQELHEVIKVISEQLINLGLKFDSTNFIRVLEDGRWDTWISTPVQTYPALVNMPYIDLVSVNEINTTIRQGLELISSYSKEVKDAFFHHFFTNSAARDIPDQRKEYVMNSPGWAISIFIAKNIGLAVSNYQGIHFSETDNDLIRRFAKVFEQSYTRFLDLQKAETQAREATIETALEKVRGKAMAMHSSNDMSATASLVFTELRKLGINPVRFGVGLLVKESRKAQLYSATTSTKGDSLALVGWVMLTGHPVLEQIYDRWQYNEDYFPVMSGDELKSYYEKLQSGISIPSIPDSKQKQYGHFLTFSVGVIYAWAENPFNEAEIKTMKRFASIVDLTFRRYIELQKAEANALESVRSASLDRIRAEIASMRTTSDLQKITPLIWSELTTLGIPFIRCGVFIMDEELRQVHTFLSTPDGKAIATLHLPFDFDLSLTINAIDHWRKKKIYTEHWDAAKFVESWTKLSTLAEASVSSGQTEAPPENLYLHMLPFLQGMLYVGNVEPLTEDMIHLLESVTEAFSTAYARYEDFNKLEAANSKIEKTLVDLKQTQTQLVQSEKMASLGELTAGIAHEIQNPLNFVNNFSEVNKELLAEMNDAIQRGDFNEAKSLTKDIIDNSEKITHHGKRADVIVKGMLQHSRASTGQKEPTDVNVLADEYLRLAYHGLRAKDKSFNATTKTEFDATIGTIQVIPQDMGRVILNLITNAFYAVNKKKSLSQTGYEPTVTMSTRSQNGKVEIRVTDNGIGIPPGIKDKIFQPFFTTKPTGQGTGLGLSMSYDIVKAHGGELKVETEEGVGSKFVIILPVG